MSETDATAPLETAPRRRLAVSTALFAIATGLSRIVGVLREIVAAAFFGVQGSISAFTVAFQVPNLVRALVADSALGAAFVPVFNDLLQRGERERAWRVASSVFWLSFVGLSAVTLVFEVLAPQVMAVFGYHSSLAVGLARVLFPTLILFGLSGVVSSMLNAFDEFFVPAIAPVAWNVVIIAVLVGAAPFWHSIDDRLYAYAIGILLGTAVQFALPLPWLRGRGGRFSLTLSWADPQVRRVFWLMLPVSLGLGLINVNLLIDTWFATRVNPELAPAAIDKAFRIYMLPQGMFSVAVATVAFPALSRAASSRDGGLYRRTLTTGLRRIAFLLVPSSVACAVLAQPMVRLVFQHGRFDAAQTQVVAQALAAFSLGLTFNGFMLMLNRAFFSLQKPWGPTKIAVATLAANGVLDALFYRPFGVWGIPLATSFVNVIGTFLLSHTLKPLVGPFVTPPFRRAMIVIVVAAALLAGVSYGVWYGLDMLLGRTLPAQFVSLLGGLVAGGLVYLRTARWLGLDEMRALAAMRRSTHGVGQRFSPRYRAPPGNTTLPRANPRAISSSSSFPGGPCTSPTWEHGRGESVISSILRVSPNSLLFFHVELRAVCVRIQHVQGDHRPTPFIVSWGRMLGAICERATPEQVPALAYIAWGVAVPATAGTLAGWPAALLTLVVVQPWHSPISANATETNERRSHYGCVNEGRLGPAPHLLGYRPATECRRRRGSGLPVAGDRAGFWDRHP